MDEFSDALTALHTGTPVLARTDLRSPWSLRFPCITGAGWYVVLAGSCYLLAPCGRPVPLGTGDMVLLREGGRLTICSDPALPPRELDLSPGPRVRQITIDGPGERTVLACGAYRLDAGRPHPLLATLPPVIHARNDEDDDDPLLRQTVAQLTTEMTAPRRGSDVMVAALMDTLVLQLIRLWYDTLNADDATEWSAAVTDPAIAPALRAIHAEPGHPWTVSALSRQSALSRAAFARRFTAVVGEPPLSYLTSWRMAMAGRLLRETDAPIAAVAGKVGYGSESAFTKAFRRAYGTAPGIYRGGAAAGLSRARHD